MLQLGDDPEWIFPLEYMAIGESFFVPTLKPTPMHYTIDSLAKKVKVKVKIFTTTKDGCMGVRVWRIS